MKHRILFIGAHADDIELGCGALISKMQRSDKYMMKAIIFSLHKPHYETDAIRQEAKQSLEHLGIKDYVMLDYKGCSSENEFYHKRQKIYDILEELRDKWCPDTVVTHHEADTNQDHAQVFEESARCYKKHATILAYEFPNNYLNTSIPNVFIEVEEQDIDNKIKALSFYRTQHEKETHNYMDGKFLKALAMVRGQTIMKSYAEAFYTVRIIPSFI